VIVASHSGNVPIGTLASILKQAGMTADELRAAL
jgi:predicted RNA binding protein YcfA (HicA-like mRNA interferase family)